MDHRDDKSLRSDQGGKPSRTIKLHKQPGSGGLRETLKKELNRAQWEAVTVLDGFNLILAGPGSGKTRVITYRVAWLIDRGVPPESILLVTFTRRAAREMVSRLESLVGPRAGQVWAGTFHHIGNRILRRSADLLGYSPSFSIMDSEDQVDLLKLAMDDAGLTGTGKMAPKPALVTKILSTAFNTGVSIEQAVQGRFPGIVEWLPQLQTAACTYAARKKAANCMDYDDLLGLWSRLVREFPEQQERLARQFRHILVDELQDTNKIQIELVETLAKSGHGNLTAVGDDAQSIYQFRGANYDNILQFPERNPGSKMFLLDVNYRSTPEIVSFTNAVLAHNSTGFEKVLVSARSSGPRPLVVPTEDGHEEAELICQLILEGCEQGIGLKSQAVLYRNHHDSILIQDELVRRKIPYQMRSGLKFFEQSHVKDVLAFLRIQANPRDESAWRRLLLMLPGIGPAKAAAVFDAIKDAPDPLATVGTAQALLQVPTKSRGLFGAFVGDLRKIQAADPLRNPAAAIQAILQGGYPAVVRAQYEHPENRIADLEQLVLLAGRSEALEPFLADQMLAGDLKGVDTLAGDEPTETLVLSTIHQAKGLEWSRVYVPRLVEDSFPHARSMNEPGGVDEERRIFYVAVTRAMNELFLTYPLLLGRGPRGPNMIATPSRFLQEIPPEFLESAQVEPEYGDPEPWAPAGLPAPE